MILPTKHISEEHALLGVGAIVIKGLKKSETVTSLWEKIRDNPSIGTFERFVLALDMLYITGLVTLKSGMIVRTK